MRIARQHPQNRKHRQTLADQQQDNTQRAGANLANRGNNRPDQDRLHKHNTHAYIGEQPACLPNAKIKIITQHQNE